MQCVCISKILTIYHNAFTFISLQFSVRYIIEEGHVFVVVCKMWFYYNCNFFFKSFIFTCVPRCLCNFFSHYFSTLWNIITKQNIRTIKYPLVYYFGWVPKYFFFIFTTKTLTTNIKTHQCPDSYRFYDNRIRHNKSKHYYSINYNPHGSFCAPFLLCQVH